MVSIPKEKLKEFCKKNSISINNGIRMSASQYRQLQKEHLCLDDDLKQKHSPNKKKSSDGGIYSFVFMIDKIDENTMKITMTGKHLSKNRYATLGLWGNRGQYAYKKAIKKAAEEYTLLHRDKFQDIKKHLPFTKATVKYTFSNPYSRDSDANQDTVKKIQDVMTELGLIIDDSRKYLIPDGAVDEVVTKKNDSEKYKAEALLRRIN